MTSSAAKNKDKTTAVDETVVSDDDAVKWVNEAESDIEALVREVINAVKGHNAKVQHDKSLSVVDLASTGVHQGVKYRQLFVEPSNGLMRVSIKETFKSGYGGEKNVKTLHSFSVPLSETQAYALLQARFFGYRKHQHLEAGRVLVDTLKNTTNSF